MIKFSIIIPTHDSGEYIREAIASVLSNNYKNFEIIIVDNGSSDDTSEYIKNIKKSECCIKFAKISIPGTGTSRNIGISMATGDYLLFLDSDDLFSSNALTKINDIVESTNSDFIVFQSRSFEESIIHSKPCDHCGNEIFNMGTMVWNKAISVSIAKKVCFPDRTFFEDVAYSAQCYLRAQQPLAVDDSLYFYRNRKNSIVHTKQIPSRRLDIIDGFELLMNDLQNKELMPDRNQVLQCQILINRTVIDHVKHLIREWGITPESKEAILQLRAYLLKVNKQIKYNIFTNSKFPFSYKVWLFLIRFKKLNTAKLLFSLKTLI